MSKNGERHYSERIGWMRAAVLGANDGIVSTASLLVGVTAADSAHSGVLVAGIAGLAAMPLIIALITPMTYLSYTMAVGSLALLGIMGGLAARAGGANIATGSFRVTFWGALAMGATAVIGKLFGTVV